jgi:hypothetical protein
MEKFCTLRVGGLFSLIAILLFGFNILSSGYISAALSMASEVFILLCVSGVLAFLVILAMKNEAPKVSAFCMLYIAFIILLLFFSVLDAGNINIQEEWITEEEAVDNVQEGEMVIVQKMAKPSLLFEKERIFYINKG